MAENIEKLNNPFLETEYTEYLTELKSLRADGEDRIRNLNVENRELKLNKKIEKEVKEKIIGSNKEKIAEAKAVKLENKEKVNGIIKEAVTKARVDGKEYHNLAKTEAKDIIVAARTELAEAKKNAKETHRIRIEEIKAKYQSDLATAGEDKKAIAEVKKDYNISLKTEAISYRSSKLEAKNNYEESLQKAKDLRNNAFLEKYSMVSKIRNGRHTPLEKLENNLNQYIYSFRLKDFFMKNGLYMIIIAFFIIVIIAGSAQGKNLFTTGHLFGILGQSSQKVFYSLGVAGLILLAGTDLSIGRLTGVGASFVCMLLSNSVYESSWGFTLDVTSLGWPMRIILAILLSIVVCTIFTSIAGFFTAKFKMHPFITTLSTQLISYGLMMVLYSQYPAFNMDTSIKKDLVGGASYTNLIIMAIVAIFIVWFIWNKTKFGKNMYAVGGNAEAASVSGINVFWVTMSVFIMAGILYGFGGFATAIQIGTANPGTGYGTELDAIAACVVGGISFSGGIGKISGAVVGTIIFTSMTYCLNFLGLDINFQYIFKGIIIMAAVCLDSLKYLKKK